MINILLVLAGGGIGALSRYGVSLLAVKLFGTGFPWGTLIVNLIGCFLIGLAFTLADQRGIINPSVRLFFVTGFLGGLTTFSSFGLESANLAANGALSSSFINIALNNIIGLALVFAGMWAGRLI
ncbi:MAG: fluoride efflux transporter CrcB [Firmicutes bacterium]|nr:fluoride efflux transporter CrcB [Bacillota bacterium]